MEINIKTKFDFNEEVRILGTDRIGRVAYYKLFKHEGNSNFQWLPYIYIVGKDHGFSTFYHESQLEAI